MAKDIDILDNRDIIKVGDARLSRIGGDPYGEGKISDIDRADVLYVALFERRMLWHGYFG